MKRLGFIQICFIKRSACESVSLALVIKSAVTILLLVLGQLRPTGRAVDPEEGLVHSSTFNKSSKKNNNNSKSEEQGWIAEHGVKQECTGLVCSVVIQPTCLQGEETSILTVHSTLLRSAAGPPVHRCSSRCCRSTCQCPSNQLFSHRQLWDKCFAGHHTRPDESVHLGPEWEKDKGR